MAKKIVTTTATNRSGLDRWGDLKVKFNMIPPEENNGMFQSRVLLAGLLNKATRALTVIGIASS
jgi:hypothetical protein